MLCFIISIFIKDSVFLILSVFISICTPSECQTVHPSRSPGSDVRLVQNPSPYKSVSSPRQNCKKQKDILNLLIPVKRIHRVLSKVASVHLLDFKHVSSVIRQGFVYSQFHFALITREQLPAVFLLVRVAIWAQAALFHHLPASDISFKISGDHLFEAHFSEFIDDR